MHRNALGVPEENLVGWSQSTAREDGVRFMGNRGVVLDGRTLFAVVAGVVAALLMWSLTSAPALAQATGGDVDLQVVDCSQVQAAVANQYNSGDAVAVSDATAGASGSAANSDAVAAISQYLDISQSQVNACLGGDGASTDTGGDDGGKTGDVDEEKDVLASTISGKELPNTGGPALPVSAFGFALLAAGILSAGAIVRRGR